MHTLVNQLRIKCPAGQNHRMHRNTGFPQVSFQPLYRRPQNLLIRPGSPLNDSHGCIRAPACGKKLPGDMTCQRCAEKQGHRAVVLGQPAQLLTFRHRRAPFGPGQDHRLRQLRHGQLRTKCRCRSEDGADARDDLIADSAQLQQRHLF
ncbi:hypothetical protein D3C81_1696440 [compost metagenome]